MYLSDLIGSKDDVLQEAMKHPALAPKRNPTVEQALKAVAGEVEARVHQNVAASVLPLVQEMYDMYCLVNGEHGELQKAGENTDDYESGMDDAVEALLEPYEKLLSANWLGVNTIDTRLWEDDAITKFAASVGKEVYKQLSYQKTPAQVLSNAGIVASDVETYLQQHLTKAPEKETDDMNENDLENVAVKIKQHIGRGFDVTEVFGDIELLVDDDEILAGGAMQRLGVDTDDWNVVQMATLEHGDDTADVLYKLVNEAEAEPKKASKPAKPKPEPKEEKKDGLDPEVFTLLQQHSAAKDTDMASNLGVSRQTFINWRKGKTVFSPDGEQYATLRQQIVDDANGLLKALALLDGGEAYEVS